jgi:hypothetical protein
MSKFVTYIPVDLATVRKSLPDPSFIDRITFDLKAEQIAVEWQNPNLETGLIVPVEFPLKDIKRAAPPKGVRVVGLAPKTEAPK